MPVSLPEQPNLSESLSIPVEPLLPSESSITTDPPSVVISSLSNMEIENPSCGTHEGFRGPLRVEKRIEILKYAENNPGKTCLDISRHFGVPRPTIYGVLKSKKSALRPPKALEISDPFRNIDSRLRNLGRPRCNPLSKLFGRWGVGVRN